MKFHTIGLNIVDTSRCRCNGIILHIRISLKEEVIITHKVRNFFDYYFFFTTIQSPYQYLTSGDRTMFSTLQRFVKASVVRVDLPAANSL